MHRKSTLLLSFLNLVLRSIVGQTKASSNQLVALPQHSSAHDREAWHAYWKAQGHLWRTEPEIDAKRQEELSKCRAIVPNVESGIYPFKEMKLSRADVEWLLATHENGRGPVDWSDEGQRERMGIDLRSADLRQEDLHGLPLARLRGGLNGNEHQEATLEQRKLAALHLENANLFSAHLEGAYLAHAHLGGTNLSRARLERGDFYMAHLESAYLREAHLEGASLRGAFLDAATMLTDVVLGNEEYGFAFLAHVRWNEANLSVVNWTQMKKLGDEYEAKQPKMWYGHAKNRHDWLRGYQRATQANRQLAIALQNRGLDEDAARFAYRAQVLRRKLLWRKKEYGRWLFSVLLALLAGYGYRMGRILVAYLLVVSLCAVAYFVIGMYYPPHLSLLQAFLESVTAFHGRVFYELFTPDTPQIWVTAFEAIMGLVIESVFIAMLTQRFFGK